MDEMTLKEKVMQVVLERQEQGLSQAALAPKAGVNQTSLSRIERGLEPAYPKRGQRIADVLGWEGELDELFQEVEVTK